MVDSARFQSPVVAGSVAAAYFANWAVPDWYIDGVVGDDGNPGTSPGLPIRTGGELLRRLGSYAIWQQSVTVHVLANGMTDPLILSGMMKNAGDHLDVIGTPTQVADAGTISSFTVFNHATPEASLLKTTLIADWSSHQWRRLRIIGGARDDSVCWVAKANPSGLGVDTARTSRWGAINTTSATAITNNVTPVNGDAVVVESLPRIPSIHIQLDGPIDNSANPAFGVRQLLVRDVDVDSIDIYTASANVPVRSITYGIAFQGSSNNAFTPSALILPMLCSKAYTRSTATTIIVAQGFWVNCLAGDGLSLVSGSIPWGASTLLCEGCGVSMTQGVVYACNDVQVFDMVGATSTAVGTSTGFRGTSISGKDNAGYGLGIFNNSVIRLTGTLNLQGAAGNVHLFSTPATNLTYTQFAVPNDWSQKGTAQLVGGTVNVAVPYLDPATQKITVSYNTPPASPGFLSVPAASRTAAGFTINSSLPADNGTVDWQISPLGRNIFFSAA